MVYGEQVKNVVEKTGESGDQSLGPARNFDISHCHQISYATDLEKNLPQKGLAPPELVSVERVILH